MMGIEDWEKEYKSEFPVYEDLEKEALFILENGLIGINKVDIDSRIKKFKSLKDKALSKELDTPFNKINDIVGLRIICLFLSDIQLIQNKIHQLFEVIEEDNKIDGYNIDSFGYMSFHFIVKMKDEYTGPRYDKIKDIPFEIQLRTITMHSWANVSHFLDYKSEKDIPEDLRRDFYALSGLFYVADKHFEMFFKSSQESRKEMEDMFKKEDNKKYEQEINLDSLTAYLDNKLPDRKENLLEKKRVSELINELSDAGYNSISDIEQAFHVAWDAFLIWEKDNPPHGANRFNQIGVIRGLFDFIDEDYREKREIIIDKKYLDLLQN